MRIIRAIKSMITIRSVRAIEILPTYVSIPILKYTRYVAQNKVKNMSKTNNTEATENLANFVATFAKIAYNASIIEKIATKIL